MDAEETRNRIRAARAYAGLGRTELADKLRELGYTKLGKDTLYNLETGRKDRAPLRTDLNAIAEACGLDPAFFTVDLAKLGQDSNGVAEQVAELRQEVAALGDQLRGTAELAEDVSNRVSALEPQPGETAADTPPPSRRRRQQGG